MKKSFYHDSIRSPPPMAKKCAYAPEYEKTFVRFPDMY